MRQRERARERGLGRGRQGECGLASSSERAREKVKEEREDLLARNTSNTYHIERDDALCSRAREQRAPQHHLGAIAPWSFELGVDLYSVT
jgi:hypothetical protein